MYFLEYLWKACSISFVLKTCAPKNLFCHLIFMLINKYLKCETSKTETELEMV